MPPETPRASRRRPRSTAAPRDQRRQLAGVDCITARMRLRQADDLLQDDELSAALDVLDQAEAAIKRAKKMIRFGR